jgi:hypothetical protein
METLKSVPFLFFMASLLCPASGCSVQTPVRSGDKPDPQKITIFYPLGNKVRGRGGPGAVSPGTKFVYIAPHPSAGSTVIRVEPDGSFEFAVFAGSKDVLEFAHSGDKKGESRGPSTYLETPLARVFRDDMYCCKSPGAAANSIGKCISPEEEKPNCKDHTPFNQCLVNANCAKFSQRNLNFPTLGLQVSSPNESGVVNIVGLPENFPPLSIVSVENRGQQGIGGKSPNLKKQYDVTNEKGEFKLAINAAGDDELVFEIYQLDGQRSPQHSAIVPDADFAGVDIVGAFPGYDFLAPNKTGRIAIRFSPYGIDGKGICPTPKARPPADPVLCFTGGLEHQMITINEMKLQGQIVASSSTSPSAELPFTRATIGNIMAGVQTIALILDVSEASFSNDPEGIRFQSAINIVNSLRTRDRLILYSVGKDETGFALEARAADSREAVTQQILRLQTMRPDESHPHRVFAAIQEASAGIIEQRTGANNGMIIVINTENPNGGRDEYSAALRNVAPNPAVGFEGFKTIVIGLDLNNRPNGRLLKDLAVFSVGSFLDVLEPREMLIRTSEVIGEISGAFVLLYDVEIPSNVGKASSIEISATVSFPGGAEKEIQSQSATYSGTIEISGAP